MAPYNGIRQLLVILGITDAPAVEAPAETPVMSEEEKVNTPEEELP